MDIYEQNKEKLSQLDYIYDRYQINFSVVLIYMSEDVKQDIDFKSITRKTDICIKVDSRKYIVIFFGLDESETFNALLSLEKKILAKYNLYHIADIFQSFAVNKTSNRTVEQMIDKCFLMLKTQNTQNFITTDKDICHL